MTDLNYNNPDLKAQFERGYWDAYANKPANYGHTWKARFEKDPLYARSRAGGWSAAYHRGYEQGHRDRPTK